MYFNLLVPATCSAFLILLDVITQQYTVTNHYMIPF